MLTTAVVGAGSAGLLFTLIGKVLMPGPHRYLRRVWEVQIALIGTAGGIGVYLGRLPWLAAGWWWLLGAVFVLGIYAFEGLVARRLEHADLGDGGP